MASTLYEVYLFDRNDQQVTALSRVRSFDVYFKGKFAFAEYVPMAWKVKKKRAYIASLIRARETKRLLKQLTREKRAERVELPNGFDYRLFDKNANRIPDTQFYKAKYFRVLKYNQKTKRWRKMDDWVFPIVSMSVPEKIEIIKKTLSKSSTVIDKAIIEYFDKEEQEVVTKKTGYQVRRFIQDYIRRDGSERSSSHRVMEFDDKIPLELIGRNFSENSIENLRKIINQEWNKEWKNVKGTEQTLSIRAKIEMRDSRGRKIGKDRWVSIARAQIETKEDFWFAIFNRFMNRLNIMYHSYASRQGQFIASIASIDIENMI